MSADSDAGTLPPGMPPNGVAWMTGCSTVEAVGPDAGKFLQAFCTNDVLKLADGDACEAMFTDVKAHVLAYGWVARRTAEAYRVLLWSDRATALAEHLDRYLIRERVELEARLAPSLALLGAEAAGRETGEAVRLDAFGPGATLLLDETPSREGGVLNDDAFERLRLRLGVPRDGVDVDERNLPQEVDRNDRAISFTKGCYLGQEPVARIDALGRVNWLLRGLVFGDPGPAEAGAELMRDGKPIGRVTSASVGEAGGVALAYVRREHAEAGIAVSAGGVNATVSALPTVE